MVYGFAGSASGPATIDPDSTVHSLRVVHDPSFIVGFVLWFDLAHHNHDLHGEACAYRPTSAESVRDGVADRVKPTDHWASGS